MGGRGRDGGGRQKGKDITKSYKVILPDYLECVFGGDG